MAKKSKTKKAEVIEEQKPVAEEPIIVKLEHKEEEIKRKRFENIELRQFNANNKLSPSALSMWHGRKRNQ